jgi:hypothetical protein
MHEGRAARAVFVCTLLLASAARAGPPYVTDDPEPTRTGGWENYAFVSGTNTPSATAGEAGVELNYGGAKDLQLSLDLPAAAFDTAQSRAGGGDVAASVKYRFIHQAEGSWAPDVAVFPAISLPTGAAAFHTGHVSFFLPVWAQKDFGKWSVFGGGGYDINPGSGQRNYGLVGLALTRSISKRLNLGIEVYRQTAQTIGGAALTNLGLGAIYQLTRHWALMASGGPGLQAPSKAQASAFYASLQFTN